MDSLSKISDCIYILYITDGEKFRINRKLNKYKINAKFFEGVDGRKIKHGTKLNDGSYGHSASFIKILEDAIKNEYERIIILEPDIYFCRNFDKKLLPHIDKIRETDLFYLGASQFMYYKDKTWDQIKISGNSYKANKTLGTFAIGFRKTIFDRYLNLLKLFEYPSDVCLVKLQEDPKIKSLVIYPNLICCDITQSSTSDATRPKQTDALVNNRWSLDYDFEDEFILQTKKDCWYELGLNINSFLPPYEIQICNNLLVRDSALIRAINRDHEESIYFKATSNETVLRMKRIFGSYTLKELSESIVKLKVSRKQLDRIKDHPLGSYYLSELYRAS